MHRSSQRLVQAALCFAASLLLLPAYASAQLDGGGLGGGTGTPIDAGGLEGDILGAVQDQGGIGGGTDGGNVGGGTGGDANGPNLDALADILGSQDINIPVPENQRDQAFVGVSPNATPNGRNEFRHVGAVNEFAGSGTGGAGTPTSRGGFSAGGGRGFGGGGTGNANGFTVQRTQTPIRSRLVPRFRTTPRAPQFVSQQVNSRLVSLPSTRRSGSRINVSMQGRTAIITGTAANAEQLRILQRQLRFEPGVSRVVNQARTVR